MLPACPINTLCSGRFLLVRPSGVSAKTHVTQLNSCIFAIAWLVGTYVVSTCCGVCLPGFVCRGPLAPATCCWSAYCSRRSSALIAATEALLWFALLFKLSQTSQPLDKAAGVSAPVAWAKMTLLYFSLFHRATGPGDPRTM